MKFVGSRFIAYALSIMLTCSSLLKLEAHFAGGTCVRAAPLLSRPALLFPIIGVELAIAVLLQTRWRHIGFWIAAAIPVCGVSLFASAKLMSVAPPSCGCLGRIALSDSQYVVFSWLVFLAASSGLISGRRSSVT
jgi:hypothetical protein